MKKHIKFIFEEDRARAQSQKAAVEDLKTIDSIPPFVSGTGVYIEISKADFVINERWYFDVMFGEDGSSSTVIISDGTDCLPEKIANLVRLNQWFCISIKQIDSKDEEKLSLMIFYEDKGIICIDEDINGRGEFSEIYFPDESTYLAYYNLHDLCIGDENEFACALTPLYDEGHRVDIIQYIDDSGVDFLAQCLVYYAM